MIRYLGISVYVSLATGEKLEGWLYGEDEKGLYIALDIEGKQIRFVPRADWAGTSYNHEKEKGHFVPPDFERTLEMVDKLEADTREPMSDAIARVDLNRIRRINQNAYEQALNGRRLTMDRRYPPFGRENELPALVSEADKARQSLDEEMRKSGLDGILREHWREIRQVASKDTMPEIDGAVAWEIEDDIRRAHEVEDFSYFEKLSQRRITYDLVAESIETKEGEDKEKPSSTMGRALKWANCGIMIAGGTGLAAGNIFLGAIAGTVLAAPTLGVGTVAAYVGALTSIYTGVIKAGEGLKSAAELLDEKPRGGSKRGR